MLLRYDFKVLKLFARMEWSMGLSATTLYLGIKGFSREVSHVTGNWQDDMFPLKRWERAQCVNVQLPTSTSYQFSTFCEYEVTAAETVKYFIYCIYVRMYPNQICPNFFNQDLTFQF